jgi:7,8-dihydropterin-6-yl-methyl-4-(beta-D-ribofuranosyl)aminobenzene 5'-phosphate synthase
MIQRITILFTLVFACSCNPSGETDPDLKNERKLIEIQENTIINLYDSFGEKKEGLKMDFGFSTLIKYKGKLILFDAGTNADILKSNVETLGVDLSQVDFAVASHVHGDHINGFDYLLSVNPDVKIYFPSDFFGGAPIQFSVEGKEKEVADSLPVHMRYFSGDKVNFEIIQSGRFWKADVEYVKGNMEIEPGINLVFTRSPYLGYCSHYPSVTEMNAMSHGNKHTDEDEVKYAGMPELSLSLETGSGEVLLVGCSHSSVQNILQETMDLTGNKVTLLAGGYHLLPYGREELNTVAQQLKEEYQVARVAPAHCTGHLAFKILFDMYGDNYLYAGLGETIQFEK